MIAKELIEEYLIEFNIRKIDDTNHLKQWLEDKLRKRMPRDLVVAQGSGGGQRYKVFWDTFDDEGNANAPVYYYTNTKSAISKMNANNHLPLQHWIDDDSEYLKY
jgi:hypothetical protein